MARGMRFRLVAVFAVCAALSFAGAAPAQADPATEIDVCCAWGTGISDAQGITYKISAPSDSIRAAISAAIQQWDQDTTSGLTLTEVFGKTGAEVTVKYKRGGGQIQGSAQRWFDGQGFIVRTKIQISGSAFGIENEAATVAQIANHEFGHALGVNHANGTGVLMSPTVTGGSATITACDRAAAVAAQHWFLSDGGGTPHQPHVGSVSC